MVFCNLSGLQYKVSKMAKNANFWQFLEFLGFFWRSDPKVMGTIETACQDASFGTFQSPIRLLLIWFWWGGTICDGTEWNRREEQNTNHYFKSGIACVKYCKTVSYIFSLDIEIFLFKFIYLGTAARVHCTDNVGVILGVEGSLTPPVFRMFPKVSNNIWYLGT